MGLQADRQQTDGFCVLINHYFLFFAVYKWNGTSNCFGSAIFFLKYRES